jgi:hypothetical protein
MAIHRPIGNAGELQISNRREDEGLGLIAATSSTARSGARRGISRRRWSTATTGRMGG